MNLFYIFFFLLNLNYGYTDDEVTWCNSNREENEKCIRFSQEIQMRGLAPALACEQGANRQDCMKKIQEDVADLMTLDAGELYVASIHHKLIPIMAELYSDSRDGQKYFSVAVIKKDSNINSLKALKGKKMCSTGAGRMAGWIVPIGALLSRNLLPVMDCNFHLKSAAAFFGDSCVPNAMDLKYNSEGDNPESLCNLCDKKNCSTEKYRSYDGALKCLSEGSGDIAFVKHDSVPESEASKYMLLCLDGTTKPITDYEMCNWGTVPAHAVVTRASTTTERRTIFQNLLEESVKRSSTQSDFNIFDSHLFGGKDLMFKDGSKGLVKLDVEQQSSDNYIGQEYKLILDALKKCTAPSMSFCVLHAELAKCQEMIHNFKEQSLQPPLICVPRSTHLDCVNALRNGQADVGVFDGGNVYVAGKHFNMKSIMSEVYGNESSSYYAVAVVKNKKSNIVLTDLKGVHSCHTGFNRTAGWYIPTGYLLSTKQITLENCDIVKSVSSFFGKSCIPGIPKDNPDAKKLCELCSGVGIRKCIANHDEPYYSYNGAFRCLADGGGNVAFVKHTTVPDNTDGKSSEPWTEGLKSNDFRLLCRDGSQASVSQFRTCHISKVPSHTIMVAPNKTDKEISAYIDIFMIAQQYFGEKKGDMFHLFTSELGRKDLIFKDSTTSLRVIPKNQRGYQDVLGKEYSEILNQMECPNSADISAFCGVLLIIHLFLIWLV